MINILINPNLKLMKKSIILFVTLAMLFACKKKEEPAPAAPAAPPQNATVTFTCAFRYWWQYPLNHTIGLGYNVADVNSYAFFDSHNWVSPTTLDDTVTYTFTVPPGTYYYCNRVYCASGQCTTDPNMSTDKVKQAAFTVTEGQNLVMPIIYQASY